jgi:TonB family protein
MQNITEFEEIKKYIPPKIEKEINKESNKNFIIADSLTENKFIETEFENQYSDSLNQIDSLSDISNIANENVENQTIYYYIDKDTGLPCDITALRSFIFENIIYPEVAIKENISGTVIIQFNATESGKVDSLIITQSINTALDNEVIRVIKILPEKILGTNYNKNLKIWYILPIKFSKL